MVNFEVTANDRSEDAAAEDVAIRMDSNDKNLYLYEEDMQQMPRVATFLKSFATFHVTYPSEKEEQEVKKKPSKAKLGAVLGVYLPTIQHIFGVLMFVRLAWIVGTMGTIQAFAMVAMCCVATFVTAISMSAIATNGVVQAGGSYFMISRNLGPECGGAVGICFYLANTFAVDLYTLGALEILLQYIAPELAYFGDIHENPWNNFRLYGTVLTIILTLIVAVGVKFVQYFAPFSLACVIISLLSIIVGGFQANASTRDVMICMLGDRLMIPPNAMHGEEHSNETEHYDDSWCTKNETGPIYSRYCHYENETMICDPYFMNNDISYIPGIPGIASGVIVDNLLGYYLDKGEVEPGVPGDYHRGEVISQTATSFVALTAIYFPSVTGIMTGSNMSGDLKDPQKSIPIGTILAQLTCSFVYLAFVLLFGATGEGALLRDKFGYSLGGELYAARLAWPSHWVVLIGAFCSTMGAAMQCFCSAPRLLQALARDDIIPFLGVFKVVTKNGEPIRALILTALIVEAGIVIANIEYVAPVIDVFFLMCYAFVNLTCALQTLLKSPNWRPRFKYYHWTISIVGVLLNVGISFTAGWYYALSAFLVAGFIYKYVEYKGGDPEWGDSIQGLSLTAARRALLKLEEEDPHAKNWRPQLLILQKPDAEQKPKYREMFTFASQLKAGKGLIISGTVLEGNFFEKMEDTKTVKECMKQHLKEDKLKGFVKVMAANDVTVGLNLLIQTAGLGGMRPNTVMLGWPYEWRDHTEDKHWKVFMDTIRIAKAKELSIIVPRYIKDFPSNKERLSGTIDVWWIVHDGGLLILLAFLLQKNKVWKACKLRLYTVAQMQDNSIQLKKHLEEFLYQLRIPAEVFVEELYDTDISAYTVERTLDMVKRQEMLKSLHIQNRRNTVNGIQEIVDATIQARKSSRDMTGENSDSMDLLTVFKKSDDDDDDFEDAVQFTFSPGDSKTKLAQGARNTSPISSNLDEKLHRKGTKLMKMHTAVQLNKIIRQKSNASELVIVNFPSPPIKDSAEENYMEYLEVLTEGLSRVLMVRGCGKEVITIYS